MLGTRGVPARHPPPRDLRDAGAGDRAAPAAGARSEAAGGRDHDPAGRLRAELELIRELRRRAVAARGGRRRARSADRDDDRAAARVLRGRPDRRQADFFSFGTNDLTQTALGFSRDDVEGRFLERYIERRILDRSPVRDDRRARRRLARAAGGVARARRRGPDLKLGVCGEHGGDPDSIAFFALAGLDYVSCSPYRVPIARLAAAQAAIRERPEPIAIAAWIGPPSTKLARTASRRAMRALEEAAARRSRHAVLPGAAGACPSADCAAAHPVPARPRPDRALQGVPAAQAQDAGVHRARGRPLPHPAHPHARGLRDRAHGGARAAAQRGPDRGDRARARPRAPALRAHRRGGARRLPARALRAALPPQRALAAAWSSGSSATVPTSPSRCATASCATPGHGPAGDARGADRAAGRPDRLHQPRHRRRACAPAILASTDLPQRGDRAARATRARSASTRWCATCVERSERGRRHRAGRGGRRRDVAPARTFMFEHVYLGPRGAERAAADRAHAARRCSSTTCEQPPPALTAGASDAEQRVVDYLAGMTDRFAIRAFEDAVAAAGVLTDGPVHHATRSSGCATRSTWSSSSARRRTCAGWARAGPGLCPFHDERTPSFSVDAEREALLLLRLRGRGDVFGSCRRPRGSTSRRRSRCWPTATASQLEREHEDPQAAERRRSSASGCSSCSTARRRSTRATCGSRGEAAAARDYLAAAGWRRRCCASSGSATRRARGTGSSVGAQRDGFTPRGAAGRRAGAARPRAAASTTASAGASCSRWPTRAGGCSASARARWPRAAGRST